MGRFVFELEGVLAARRAAERAAQVALARVESERAALERGIREAHEGMTREREGTREYLEGRVDVAAARRQAGVVARARATTQRLVLQLAGVHRKIERARAELIEASRRRQAVEKLRERRWEAWMEAEKRREAAMLDELAVMRAGRGREASSEVAA